MADDPPDRVADRLGRPWEDDDPDANFKADVALYAHVDPMTTISRLAGALDIPEGAVVRYVLAKWASAGSGGLLELGPSMVHRLWAPVEASGGRGYRCGPVGGVRAVEPDALVVATAPRRG